LSDVGRLRKTEIISDLEMTTLYKEVNRKQKSRALWLREGDKNTKFFHHATNSNKSNNIIDSLVHLHTLQKFGSILCNFTLAFIQSNLVCGPNWMVFLSILAVLGRLWMERAFEKSGVFEVVKALNGYKVLGLEGFSLAKS